MTELPAKFTRAYCYECSLPVSSHPTLTCYRSSEVRYATDHTEIDQLKEVDFTYPYMAVDSYSGPEDRFPTLMSPGKYIDNHQRTKDYRSEVTSQEWDDNYSSDPMFTNPSLVPEGWSDRHPNECTTTLQGTEPVIRLRDKTVLKAVPGPKSINEVQDQTRNTYVEGLEGFTSSVMIDEYITNKFHQKLMNSFIGRDRKLHIGALTISTERDPRTGTSKVMAVCNHPECYVRGQKRALVAPTAPTRSEMEDFVFALIRHSNKHAPTWMLRDKPNSVYNSIGELEGENHEVTRNTVLV